MSTNSTESEALRDDPDRVMSVGPGTVEIPVLALTELLEATTELNEAAGPRPSAALEAALLRVGAATSSVVLPHIIDTVERNAGPGRELPKFLEYMLAEHLDQPADRPGAHPRNLDDRLYLRWLAHRPIDVDAATIESFHRRWAARDNSRP
ncbi:hypothetical protein ACNJ7E_43625 [Rhodococcus sp. NM-2]|uniref:hypothetical protein n=1 Tax=Rhodococcus sp. NM-2 TaxID=3401174 RepID=UPI003AAB1713